MEPETKPEIKIEPKRPVFVDPLTGVKYANESPDTIPPTNKLKFVDEKGIFTANTPSTKESNTAFWKSKTHTLMLLIIIPSIIFMLIILGATTKYQEELWQLLAGSSNNAIGFLFGLIPKF